MVLSDESVRVGAEAGRAGRRQRLTRSTLMSV